MITRLRGLYRDVSVTLLVIKPFYNPHVLCLLIDPDTNFYKRHGHPERKKDSLRVRVSEGELFHFYLRR